MASKALVASVALLLVTVGGTVFFAFTQKSDAVFLPVRSVAFSSKGDLLAVGGGKAAHAAVGRNYTGSGEIRVWETASWNERFFTRDGFTDSVSSVFFVSDDCFACVSCRLTENLPGNRFELGLIRSWDTTDFAERKALQVKEGFRGQGFHQEALSPAKDRLAIAGRSGSVVIYDLKRGFSLFTLAERSSFGTCFSSDGLRLLSCAKDRPALRVYDTADGTLVAKRDLESMLAACAQYTPDGNHVVVVDRADFDHLNRLVTRSGEARIHVFEADLQKEIVNIEAPYIYLQKYPQETALPDAFYQECPLAIAPDSQTFAVKGSLTSVILLETKTGKLVRTFDGNSEGVNCVTFSPDGRWLAVGAGGHDGRKNGPGAVRVWDVRDGSIAKELK